MSSRGQPLRVADDLDETIVFVNGVRVRSPFVFTGVGTDTLRLNGMAVLPTVCPAPQEGSQGSGESARTLADLPAETRTAIELSSAHSATTSKLVLAIINGEVSLPMEERIQLAREECERLPFVKAVSTTARSMSVTFVDTELTFEMLFGSGGGPPNQSNEERHKSYMKLFEHKTATLCAVGCGYTQLGTVREAQRVLQAIEQADRGSAGLDETRPPEGWSSRPALWKDIVSVHTSKGGR